MDRPQQEHLEPVVVRRGTDVVPVTSGRQRTVLAVLALSAGRTVDRTRLIESLWGDDAPASAEGNLQTHVWGLRKVFADDSGRLVTSGDGYLLRLEATECDVTAALELQRVADRAQAEGRPQDALAAVDEALALWRGTPLHGVGDLVVDRELPWLQRLRSGFRQQRAVLALQLGRTEEALRLLAELVVDEPLDEQVSRWRATALHRAGSRAEALAELARYRDVVRTELGLDPSPEAAALQEKILEGQFLVLPGEDAAPRPVEPPAKKVRAFDPLPAVPRGFAGRRAELGELRDLLTAVEDRPVVVVIDGPGGLGKSTLAVRAAHDVVEDFPDGCVHVACRGFTAHHAPLTAPDVVGRVLRALGVRDEALPAGSQDQEAVLRDLLHERRVLLVLDDVRDAEVVRAVLPGAGRSAVVVTTRNRMSGLVARDAAVRLTVRPMEPAESLAVLARALGIDRFPVAHLDTATRLVSLCGNWPLALRVVATRIDDVGLDGLPDVVAELEDVQDRLDLLAVDDDETATVSAVLDWSYRALGPDEARVFRLFGLAGCADLPVDALVAMSGMATDRVRRSLSRLSDQHLLERLVVPRASAARTGQRWRMHDLLQLLALQHAGEDNEDERDAARQRLWDWYGGEGARARAVVAPDLSAELPEPGDPPTLTAASAWLAVETANLLDLADQALREGAPQSARTLLLVLGGFVVDPTGRSRRRELLTTVTRPGAELQDDVALALELVDVDLRDGEVTRALDRATWAAQEPGTSDALRVLATVQQVRCLVQAGRLEDAEDLVHGFAGADREHATRMGLLDLATQLAAVRGSAQEVLAVGRQALDVPHKPVLRYRSLTAVAIAWQRAGLLAQARELRLEAAVLAAELGSLGWAVHSRVIASRLSQRVGDLGGAARDAADAVSVVERLDPDDGSGYAAPVRALLAELTRS